jgi:hypothetical protein
MNTLIPIDPIENNLLGKSNEWYTPSRYIEAAKEVMGGIDLDPASSEVANKTVKAARYYTIKDNGLLQDWRGRIWLNPPYGRTTKMQGQHKSTIYLFTEKLIKSYESGEVEQAIILATTEVNARWFYPLWKYPICIPDHRVHFMVDEKLEKYCQMFGTCFAYLGPNEAHFTEVFSRFGHVVKTVGRPAPKPIALDLWTPTSVAP